MKGLLVLAGAALAIALGVLALAELILPDAVTPAAPEAAPESPDPEVVSSASISPAAWPPDAVGGVIEVTGDRPGSIEVDESRSVFSSDTRLELASSESSMLFGEDDGMLFVDQMTYDGLNFFLEPGDCGFSELDRTEDFGLVRLEITCTEISDVQGNNTVTMQGAVDVPITIGVMGDEYASGGTLSLSGDVDAALTVTDAFWYDYPEDMQCAGSGCAADTFQDSLFVSTYRDSSNPDDPELVVEFDIEERPPRLAKLTYQPDPEEELTYRFTPQPDDCTVEETDVARIAPDTELLEIALDCSELTGEEGETVSLSGALAVHRVAMFSDIQR